MTTVISLNQIYTLQVDIQHPVIRHVKSLDIGVKIEDNNTLLLFCIDKNIRNHFPRLAAWVCYQILDKLKMDGHLHDYNWIYISQPVICEIQFHTHDGYPVEIEFMNGEIFSSYIGSESIETYKEALMCEEGIAHYLQNGYPPEFTFFSEPKLRYLVHTPRHSQKIHTLDHPYDNLPIEEYPVFRADSKKFISYWKKQCQRPDKNKLMRVFDRNQHNDHFCIIDDELLSSTVEDSLEHGIPSIMATGVGLNHNNHINFTNGRHRAVNMANLGAPYIPIQVQKNSLDAFNELFYWGED